MQEVQQKIFQHLPSIGFPSSICLEGRLDCALHVKGRLGDEMSLPKGDTKSF